MTAIYTRRVSAHTYSLNCNAFIHVSFPLLFLWSRAVCGLDDGQAQHICYFLLIVLIKLIVSISNVPSSYSLISRQKKTPVSAESSGPSSTSEQWRAARSRCRWRSGPRTGQLRQQLYTMNENRARERRERPHGRRWLRLFWVWAASSARYLPSFITSSHVWRTHALSIAAL